MNVILSKPRYVCEIALSTTGEVHETFAFEATIDPSEELIASGIGTIRSGSILFHRMSTDSKLNAEMIYLELDDEIGNKIRSFHCDIPVDDATFDRWLISSLLQFEISLNLNFGFSLQSGLEYGGSGWRTKIWSTEAHPRLSIEEVSVIANPNL